jgi:hypothetical protein
MMQIEVNWVTIFMEVFYRQDPVERKHPPIMAFQSSVYEQNSF